MSQLHDFDVEITETLCRTVRVRAEGYSEAALKAKDEYRKGIHVLGDEDMVGDAEFEVTAVDPEYERAASIPGWPNQEGVDIKARTQQIQERARQFHESRNKKRDTGPER